MKRTCVILIANCLLFIANCYSQPVTQEWVKRYSGFGYANGLSVKLDSSGNIYVLLKMYTDTTFNDYGLLKYSNNGSLLWDRYYNSPGNLSEQPVAFCVNDAGEVYITGISSVNFVDHITTVKFSTNGALKWARAYNSGGPSDGASAISLDNSGNVIVIGGSAVNNNLAQGLIIKYNTDGDSIWVRKFAQLPQYSHFEKMTIDDSNNVYVVGDYGDTLSDCLILKCRDNGNLLWYQLYDSPEHYSDVGSCIGIDSNRILYVLSSNHVVPYLFNNTLLKLNSGGAIQWSRVFTGILSGQGHSGAPAGIVISTDGNSIYYTTSCLNGNGAGGYDIVTLKYNTTGDTQWVRRYAGEVTSNGNYPSAINLDFFNNVYVTGTQNNLTSGDDYVTIKYLQDGSRQWVASYTGPLSSSFDDSHDLVIDKNMNVYVTGISSRLNSTPILWDAATIKYNQPNGIISYNSEFPTNYKLYQNHPNPFNPTTNLKFDIPPSKGARGMITRLVIYDILGREVASLIPPLGGGQEGLPPGTYAVTWDGSNCPSGVYFYRLEVRQTGSSTGSFAETRKMVLIK